MSSLCPTFVVYLCYLFKYTCTDYLMRYLLIMLLEVVHFIVFGACFKTWPIARMKFMLYLRNLYEVPKYSLSCVGRRNFRGWERGCTII